MGAIDDEFFQVTCHVDSTLRGKIEKGEFVELEKLIPKDRVKKMSNDSRMEWIRNQDGTFLVPAVDKGSTINGVKRWDQEFRVYAAIYCKANPNRSAEIWQYVHIIHTAAASFIWENVAYYDYTFRQLMSVYPQRSWATTYNQMWNLAMKDHITSRPFQGNSFGGGGGGSDNPARAEYCWRFNKNRCKFGSKCRYEHRCFYCDGYGHGKLSCNRRGRRDQRKFDRNDKFDKNRDTQQNVQSSPSPAGDKN